MLFYKIEGMMKDCPVEEEDNRRARRETARKFSVKSEEFHRKRGQTSYCFVAGVSEGVLTVGMITEHEESVQELTDGYLAYIECPLKDVTVCETTISGMEQLLGRANRGDFIDDDDVIFEKFGIDKVLGRRGLGIDFGENLLVESDRKTIVDNAERYFMNETLHPELERIFACPAAAVQGHPVHYLMRTDNTDTRREATRLLLQALYSVGRLRSKRYCFLDFHPGDSFSNMAYDSLYNVCAGGTVIVRYQAGDEADDDAVSGAQDTVERICEVAKRYRHQVLTVFCLPRNSKHVASLFYKQLGSMTLVELQEDFCDHDRACSYLRRMAKDNRIRADKALFAALDPENKYLATDLRTMFDEWYDAKLKTSVYPQYKTLNTVTQETVKAVPKGSAYEELHEMIGLTEAKAVIRKALNYCKMQKLYEEKGVKADSPALHMVFTGNPGTAKTTAARLFARIMKDNGLLSRGQLIEVGRGDLVGKYVGWTAQTVQAKFRAAKGGVLFIDEAYSLVDDRNGSFGDEAINTIVQEMENHRRDVVVIFAGYPDEMERFLQKNPGLRSRIAFHVPFADYDTDELCRIAEQMGQGRGVRFDDGALTALSTLFETARRNPDFGNGRYVRNVLEQAAMNQASRLIENDVETLSADEVCTIRAADIVMPDGKSDTKRPIGFAS